MESSRYCYRSNDLLVVIDHGVLECEFSKSQEYYLFMSLVKGIKQSHSPNFGELGDVYLTPKEDDPKDCSGSRQLMAGVHIT